MTLYNAVLQNSPETILPNTEEIKAYLEDSEPLIRHISAIILIQLAEESESLRSEITKIINVMGESFCKLDTNTDDVSVSVSQIIEDPDWLEKANKTDENASHDIWETGDHHHHQITAGAVVNITDIDTEFCLDALDLLSTLIKSESTPTRELAGLATLRIGREYPEEAIPLAEDIIEVVRKRLESDEKIQFVLMRALKTIVKSDKRSQIDLDSLIETARHRRLVDVEWADQEGKREFREILGELLVAQARIDPAKIYQHRDFLQETLSSNDIMHLLESEEWSTQIAITEALKYTGSKSILDHEVSGHFEIVENSS